jgi:hypothetical protein
MQEQYKAQGFIVIAAHCQDVSQEKVVGLCRAKKINYTVVSRGRCTGDDSNGIPHAFLFGPDGKVIKEGHPNEMTNDIDQAVKNSPHWITRGRPLTSAANKIALGLAAGKNFSWALDQCESLLKKNDDKAKEEAQYLKDQILAEGDKTLDAAKAAEANDPNRAMDLYSQVSKDWKKSEPATKADARLKELKSDKPFQDELKIAKDVAKIQDMCDQLTLPMGKEEYDLTIPQNQQLAQQITAAAKSLKAKHADSPQTKRCLDGLKAYGFKEIP